MIQLPALAWPGVGLPRLVYLVYFSITRAAAVVNSDAPSMCDIIQHSPFGNR